VQEIIWHNAAFSGRNAVLKSALILQIKEMDMLHQDTRQTIPAYAAFLPSTLR
jgi:hypothetical protein